MDPSSAERKWPVHAQPQREISFASLVEEVLTMGLDRFPVTELQMSSRGFAALCRAACTLLAGYSEEEFGPERAS